MVAVEFATPAGPGAPHDAVSVNKPVGATMASRVAKKCIEKGMLILTTSVYEVVRFIPPLNISATDLAKGTDIFREAVEEVIREG
jgi:4-aminobutyrate aminotransferase